MAFTGKSVLLMILLANVLGFLLALALNTKIRSRNILRAIVFALDIVAELPVLGFINRLAGGVVGLGCALIIVWVAFIIITMLYMTSIGKEAYELIQNNDIIKMIYDYNPIMQLAVKF